MRLQWRRVDVPAFSREEEPLLYMIEMQEPPSTRWREVASRISDNYYIVRDLEPATDYRFRVRAETLDGLRSEPSPATSIYRTLGVLVVHFMYYLQVVTICLCKWLLSAYASRYYLFMKVVTFCLCKWLLSIYESGYYLFMQVMTLFKVQIAFSQSWRQSYF